LAASLNEALRVYGGMMATWTMEELRGGNFKVGFSEKRVRIEVTHNGFHSGTYL
jgi:hypothetical protein